MPRISPFAALRYTAGAGDPASLIAPPYDVIAPPLAAELRARSPYNAVRLVLPEGDGDARYRNAAEQLGAWVAGGVLGRDDAPAAYAYRQRYERDGATVERLALFGALELEDFGAGVLPHERTHAGPKQDRLALTLATRTQLSPIFLLARDPEANLLEALRVFADSDPDLAATTPDGVEHTLWVVDDEGAADVLCALAGRHPLLIADGHHRYETALEVARILETEPTRHVLACVVSSEDPGLVIRPTHRTLTARAFDDVMGTAAELRERLGTWFDVDEMPGLRPADAEVRVADEAAGMIVIPGNGTSSPFKLSARTDDDAAAADGAAGDDAAGDDAAAGIAAVQFDRRVVRELMGTDADTAAREGKLEYHRDAGEAARRAAHGGAAFILPPVRLEAVWHATIAGIRLPPKSTYFEPKIPSGLLFRPLD